jgi:hypothetical protein
MIILVQPTRFPEMNLLTPGLARASNGGSTVANGTRNEPIGAFF